MFNVPEFHSSEVTFFQNWYFRNFSKKINKHVGRKKGNWTFVFSLSCREKFAFYQVWSAWVEVVTSKKCPNVVWKNREFAVSRRSSRTLDFMKEWVLKSQKKLTKIADIPHRSWCLCKYIALTLKIVLMWLIKTMMHWGFSVTRFDYKSHVIPYKFKCSHWWKIHL